LYSCVNYYVDANDNNKKKPVGSSIKLTCYYISISSVNPSRTNSPFKPSSQATQSIKLKKHHIKKSYNIY